MKIRFAVAVDAACVVLFALLGRRSHDEGNLVWGTVVTAAPFLLALGVAWLAGRSFWKTPLSWRLGVHLWGATLLIGMLARHFVFDRGTATSFIVVAAVFLGVFLVGWRLLAGTLVRRRDRAAGGATTSTVS